MKRKHITNTKEGACANMIFKLKNTGQYKPKQKYNSIKTQMINFNRYYLREDRKYISTSRFDQ